MRALPLQFIRDATMPKYFFHVRDGKDVLLDPEGVQLAPGAVAGYALRAARDCIAHEAKTGRIDMDQRVEVEDEAGTIVHRLEFGDAVQLIEPPRLPLEALRPFQ